MQEKRSKLYSTFIGCSSKYYFLVRHIQNERTCSKIIVKMMVLHYGHLGVYVHYGFENI